MWMSKAPGQSSNTKWKTTEGGSKNRQLGRNIKKLPEKSWVRLGKLNTWLNQNWPGMSSFYTYVVNTIKTRENVWFFFQVQQARRNFSSSLCFLTKNTEKFALKCILWSCFCCLYYCIIRGKVILVLLWGSNGILTCSLSYLCPLVSLSSKDQKLESSALRNSQVWVEVVPHRHYPVLQDPDDMVALEKGRRCLHILGETDD